MKKLITGFCALLIVSIGFWACRKQDFLAENNGYKQDATFFKRNDSLTGQFAKINGNLTDELLLNKLIDEFKAYDKEKQIAEGIKEKYGKPQWDISIVLKNENGFRTIATPILNINNEVTSMGLFYQTSGTTFDFKIVSRKTKQTNLPEFGDKAATVFTKASLLGLFQVADNSTANATLLKQNVNNNITHGVQTQGINYSYVCWNYSSYHQRADGIWEYTFTSMQCSLSIVFTANAMPKVQEIGEEGGSGRIGGGGGSTNQQNNPDSIIDKLDSFPCAQEVLKQMPNANAEVKKILQDVFGVNADVNIIFKADPNLPASVSGSTERTYSGNGSIDYTVSLSENMLNNATKDYLLATYIHEGIHAYIFYQRQDLDTATFAAKFPIYWQYRGNQPHHNEMANNFVLLMQKLIKQMNPNISDEVARGLAWGGLQKTTAWKNLSDTATINNINVAGQTGDTTIYKMKKCN